MLKLSPEQIVEAIKLLERDERKQLTGLLSKLTLESALNFKKLSPTEQKRLSELIQKQKSGTIITPQEQEELERLLEQGEALTLNNMATYIEHLEKRRSNVGPT